MQRWLVTLMLFGLAASVSAQEVVVVANTQDDNLRLQRHEVRNLFMGSVRQADLRPVALPVDHPARVLFNTKVVGLTESRVQAYWAQMRFSGRGRAPREMRDAEALVSYLRSTPGAVGYLPSDVAIPDELTVIYSSD